jgi:hypothetical protein
MSTCKMNFFCQFFQYLAWQRIALWVKEFDRIDAVFYMAFYISRS